MKDVLNFGKHKGKSLREVLNEDFSYILWLNSIQFNIPSKILEEAEKLKLQEDDIREIIHDCAGDRDYF